MMKKKKISCAIMRGKFNTIIRLDLIMKEESKVSDLKKNNHKIYNLYYDLYFYAIF